MASLFEDCECPQEHVMVMDELSLAPITPTKGKDLDLKKAMLS